MADFYMQAQKENSENILLRHARRRRIAKWVLLGALLYCVILDILHFIVPESPTVYYLRPFSDANIDGHMIFGMTGRQCQTTIANGKLLMKDRELIGIDEEAENAHILEEAKKLWRALDSYDG